jgi:AcrR family transcriptional regulator
MARRTTYSRDDVIQAALEVLAAAGPQAVTARRVADALGSSTAPVYSNFASMEDLLAAVRRQAAAVILTYCRRPWCPDSFLSMGLGFVHFARDYPQLFRALYLEPLDAARAETTVLDELVLDLDRHRYLGALPQDHKDELLFQASVYTLGIATTVVTGRWEDPDLPMIEGWLRSVGGLLVRAAMTSAGLAVPPELEQDLGRFVVPWRHPHSPLNRDGNDA